MDLETDGKDHLDRTQDEWTIAADGRKQRSLIDTILERLRNWITHILRDNSLPRTVLEGKWAAVEQEGSQGSRCSTTLWHKATPSSATANWRLRHKTDRHGVRTWQPRQRTEERERERERTFLTIHRIRLKTALFCRVYSDFVTAHVARAVTLKYTSQLTICECHFQSLQDVSPSSTTNWLVNYYLCQEVLQSNVFVCMLVGWFVGVLLIVFVR